MCNWIDEDKLQQAMDAFIQAAKEALTNAEKRKKRNVVDPFQSLVFASIYNLPDVKVLESMQTASFVSHSISNAVGAFHQRILSSVDGWTNHDRGYDLVCEGKKILAEIKNKHNTMNADNRIKVIDNLVTAVRQKQKGWKAYLVTMIPKTPERYCREIKSEVYEIDGASFYEEATGRRDGLRELFDALRTYLKPPAAIDEHILAILNRSLPV